MLFELEGAYNKEEITLEKRGNESEVLRSKG